MRNMLAFLAAMTLAFVCTGWYLDWFSFRSTPAPSGQRSVTIDINTKKMGRGPPSRPNRRSNRSSTEKA